MARPSGIYVGTTELGNAVFAARKYTRGKKIAQIEGTIISDPDYSSRYCIDLGEGRVLEPASPIRFLNHSCQPTCELVLWEDDEQPEVVDLCLHALERIEPGDELTIDYGWPADAALPCRCGAKSCRGWIVSADELSSLKKPASV